MNARGEKEQTRYTSNTGFNYFSQLGDVSKARCVLFWGRGADWEGILGPHWLAARRCGCAPAAPRASLIWRVNVEEPQRGVQAFLSRDADLFQEESAVGWLPGLENLLWTKGDKMQGSLLLQWFRRKKERQRKGERERDKGLTFGSRLGWCIPPLLFLLLLLQLPVLPSGNAPPSTTTFFFLPL